MAFQSNSSPSSVAKAYFRYKYLKKTLKEGHLCCLVQFLVVGNVEEWADGPQDVRV